MLQMESQNLIKAVGRKNDNAMITQTVFPEAMPRGTLRVEDRLIAKYMDEDGVDSLYCCRYSLLFVNNTLPIGPWI